MGFASFWSGLSGEGLVTLLTTPHMEDSPSKNNKPPGVIPSSPSPSVLPAAGKQPEPVNTPSDLHPSDLPDGMAEEQTQSQKCLNPVGPHPKKEILEIPVTEQESAQMFTALNEQREEDLNNMKVSRG